jgi:Kef-type K+ transport system membrane component KefB
MEMAIAWIFVFFIIAVSPLISKRIKMPVIVIEIIFGIILGKSFLKIIPNDPIIDFFSSFGLVYLMFLAGLEIDFNEVKRNLSNTLLITLFSISVPFATGVLLSPYLGLPALFLGTILSTTSIGLILPLACELDCNKNFLNILLSSVILVDIIGMFLLAFSLSLLEGALKISFLYSLIAVISLFLIPYTINKWNIKIKIKNWEEKKSNFELEVRFAFAIIFVLAAVSEELGFHSIIGAFIGGLIISEILPKKNMRERIAGILIPEFNSPVTMLERKLEGFGYGFFIPLFFIFVGSKVDLPLVFSNLDKIGILIMIILAGLLPKLLGVSFITKIRGFKLKESLAMGLFHATRLSLIIAAVEIGSKLGIIQPDFYSMFVILAVISSITGPSLGKFVLSYKRIRKQNYTFIKNKN